MRVKLKISDLGTIVNILLLRHRVTILLRDVPLDICLRSLSKQPWGYRSLHNRDKDLDRIFRLTDWLLKRQRFTCTTCFRRALVRYTMINQLNLNTVFMMGVKPDSDDVEGHAWVTLNGNPLMEDEYPNYIPTFIYPNNAMSE